MSTKVCQSRKSTHSIMNNGGLFGMLFISRPGTTVQIAVPEDWLFSDGRIKEYAKKKIDKMFAKAIAYNNEGQEIIEKPLDIV